MLSALFPQFRRLLQIRHFRLITQPLVAEPFFLSTNTPHFPSLNPFVLLSKPFSSSTDEIRKTTSDDLVQSLSAELLKTPGSDSLSLPQRLDLTFSHITPSQVPISEVLNLSPDAGRAVLDFHGWLFKNPRYTPSDDTVSLFIDYFGRRKDFKAIHEILVNDRSITGPKTLASSIDRLVRAGRASQTVAFFERMERDYGFVRDKQSLMMIVEKLCEKGYASYAEKMVKNLAHEFFPNETMCAFLIKGWCVDGKLDEAKRLAQEMYRGGFEIGRTAYNSILDCVCKLCRKKDPFRLHSEVKKVLVDMDSAGVPRDVETFNVLINNFCKIRKTEDAMNLFYRMGEWGCHPNSTTFVLLIRSLYQAGRIGEGDEMIDRMKSAGFAEALDLKTYYGFLKILCGIERIDHAISVFKRMKKDGFKPGIKTYDLLMGKLCSHGSVDKANAMFNEALTNGLPVTPKAYRVDPRFAKKKAKVVKKEKPRETLPEKMVRKRRRLKKFRLSFVKKPKRGIRRAV